MYAPEGGVKGETSGTGLSPRRRHQDGTSGSTSSVDNAPESGTQGNYNNAGQSQSKYPKINKQSTFFIHHFTATPLS